MNFITNAPTPPRWFDFILEPGKLQQHLDSSPLQLITLFLENISFPDPSVPPDSFEYNYLQKKAEALQTLALKVASFLDWNLDNISNGLPTPVQYKLLQALVKTCSDEECPVGIKKFATVLNCHWSLRTALAHNLEPQACSNLLGGVQLQNCANDLSSYLKELSGVTERRVKRVKSSHPFEKAKLNRPKMECFNASRENDWKQSVKIEAYEFLEASCYDLGRFYFFEEYYEDARTTFEMIKSDKYPLLDQYLTSSNEMLSKDTKESSPQPLTNTKREQTEKYLFDCMKQFAQSKKVGDENGLEVLISGQKYDSTAWSVPIPADYHQQQLMELSRGDMCMSRGDFEQAMGCFVGALMLMSDYFRNFSKNYTEEEPYILRMIQCSASLSCYTQAVALCQMTKNMNYTIAFKQLNERICNDCCDDIYECIWNVTILEYIINLHARRGEIERRTRATQLMGQLELNENNPDDMLREAEHVRRGRFFRIMSNKYL